MKARVSRQRQGTKEKEEKGPEIDFTPVKTWPTRPVLTWHEDAMVHLPTQLK